MDLEWNIFLNQKDSTDFTAVLKYYTRVSLNGGTSTTVEVQCTEKAFLI